MLLTQSSSIAIIKGVIALAQKSKKQAHTTLSDTTNERKLDDNSVELQYIPTEDQIVGREVPDFAKRRWD